MGAKLAGDTDETWAIQTPSKSSPQSTLNPTGEGAAVQWGSLATPTWRPQGTGRAAARRPGRGPWECVVLL